MFRTDEYSRNAKTTQPTNRLQLNKSDRPQVNIWDTWKTWKYLNINDSFHLKGLEISKYKRESKARMQIKKFCLIFVNCGLFSFLNIEKVKIYNENTIADGNVLCKRIHRRMGHGFRFLLPPFLYYPPFFQNFHINHSFSKFS